jgi:preprotein translocase subunit SecA
MGITGEGTSADELWELGTRDAITEHLMELADARLESRAAEIGEADWGTVERMVLVRTIDSLWVEHLTEIDDMRRGIGLRGYAQQDPLNEFRREAYDLYEELRSLIRHGVASSIFRVTVTRQPAPQPGGDPAVAASLAAGAAALRGGNGAARPTGTASGAAGSAGAASGPAMPAAGSPGSAIVKGALPAAPKISTAREQLGDAPVAAGGAGSTGVASGAASANGAPAAGFTPSGARIGRNDACWCGSGAKYKKCHGR